MKRKLVVWGLFDDANRCYYNSLKDNYEVYSIGINNLSDNYLKVNLSILNEDLFKELDKLPKPDIILASPPCNSWSIADANTVFAKEIKNNNEETSITFNNFKFYENHNKITLAQKRRNAVSKMKLFLNGLSTSLATIEIIKKYEPKYYVIENPSSSKIWKIFEMYNFLESNIINKTYYRNYNKNFTNKSTIFLSNIDLNLNSNMPIFKQKKNLNSYSRKERSDIPTELIREIAFTIEDDFYKEYKNNMYQSDFRKEM